MAAEISGTEGEECGVHWSLEEEEEDEDDDCTLSVGSNDDSVEGDCADGVYHQEEVGLEDGSEYCGNEATDGEGDEGIRQHVGGLG